MINETHEIYIIGAGGLGREVLCLLRRINAAHSSPLWEIKGFVDKSGVALCADLPVISHEQFLQMKAPRAAALAIGNPQSRSKIVSRYSDYEGITYPNLIHPSVIIEDPETVVLGIGNTICANVVLTTNITLGNHNYINLSCTIGHDVTVANCNVVNPSVNVSGEVFLESNCLLGTGCQILQQLRIGEGAKVGAGAVVIRHVDPYTTVVGVPAKVVKRIDG